MSVTHTEASGLLRRDRWHAQLHAFFHSPVKPYEREFPLEEWGAYRSMLSFQANEV